MSTATALRYIDLLVFESPFAILIKNARQDQEWTDRKIQAIRRAVKSGEPYTPSMRSDVETYSRMFNKAVWLEETCERLIEKRANKQGLTTIRSKAD